ncbi:MAG: VOC family protein [Marmoricola sp.]
MLVGWLTAFLDIPAGRFDDAVRFWCAVTGSEASTRRGDRDQVATLLPPEGEPWLRVQRLRSGGPGMHLDLHAADRASLCALAEELGATRRSVLDDLTVLASPGGLRFCVVSGSESGRAAPVDWGNHHRSVADQVCVDIPPSAYDHECAFWSALLERRLERSASREFLFLDRPAGQQLRILLQRLDDEQPEHAHLDLASDDRDAEVRRVRDLGASQVRVTDDWTTLADPSGLEFCVTDRDPWTGDVAGG